MKGYLFSNLKVPTLYIEINCVQDSRSEAKFKEFEPRLKFKPRLKYGWFHLKLYSIFQDLSRGSLNSDKGIFRHILNI